MNHDWSGIILVKALCFLLKFKISRRVSILLTERWQFPIALYEMHHNCDRSRRVPAVKRKVYVGGLRSFPFGGMRFTCKCNLRRRSPGRGFRIWPETGVFCLGISIGSR